MRAARGPLATPIVAAACFVTLLVALAPRAPAATTRATFGAAADASVSALHPLANYGSSERLRADAAPEVRSYIRFDVRGLGGAVVSARLRLTPARDHASGVQVRSVADTGWDERGVTFANAPTPAAVTTASSGRLSAGQAVSLDVTSLVRGDGPVAVALLTPSATAAALFSREAGASGPQLVVDTSTTGDTTPPSAPGNLRVTSAGQTDVGLAWTAATDDVGVTAYRVRVGGSPVATSATTSAHVTGLSCGTGYAFSVEAVDAAGNVSAGAAASGSTAPCAVPPAPGSNVTLPARGAFYYPWFPETWTVNGAHVAYHPALGYYSSSDAAVQQAHIRALDYAHVQVAISSWWGASHYTNDRLAQLLSRTVAMGSPLKWAVYYELEGNQDPSAGAIAADLAAIRDHLATSSAFARVGGRFVVFVYNANDTTCAVADRWRQANESLGSPAYVVLKVFSGYATCASQPSSWHQYAPAKATDRQPGYSFAISPGFWRADEPAPRLGRDLARFRQNVRDLVASGEPWQLVTTFDEWGEGTATEAAAEWASTSGYGGYLDALHDDGG